MDGVSIVRRDRADVVCELDADGFADVVVVCVTTSGTPRTHATIELTPEDVAALHAFLGRWLDGNGGT